MNVLNLRFLIMCLNPLNQVYVFNEPLAWDGKSIPELSLNPLNQVYVFNWNFIHGCLFVDDLRLNPLNQVYVFNQVRKVCLTLDECSEMS